MISLANVAVPDQYDNVAVLGPILDARYIAYSVFNNAFFMQVAPQTGSVVQDWGPEQGPFAPTNGATLSAAVGVRFRNAVAGSAARVVAQLFQSADPVQQGGTPTTVTLAATGGVTTIGSYVSGQVSSAGAPVAGSGYTVVHTGTGIYTITFTTPFANPPTVIPTAIQSAGGRVLTLQAPPTNSQAIVNIRTAAVPGALTDEAFEFLAFTTI